jgi:hypothetical protein
MKNDFIAMGRCPFCGKDNGQMLIQKHLSHIKDEERNGEPCGECLERFKTFCYFIGDCGHSGFVKKEYLEKTLPKNIIQRIGKIFRMEKCFACLNGQGAEQFEKI